jgi:hypothetical protein
VEESLAVALRLIHPSKDGNEKSSKRKTTRRNHTHSDYKISNHKQQKKSDIPIRRKNRQQFSDINFLRLMPP